MDQSIPPPSIDVLRQLFWDLLRDKSPNGSPPQIFASRQLQTQCDLAHTKNEIALLEQKLRISSHLNHQLKCRVHDLESELAYAQELTLEEPIQNYIPVTVETTTKEVPRVNSACQTESDSRNQPPLPVIFPETPSLESARLEPPPSERRDPLQEMKNAENVDLKIAVKKALLQFDAVTQKLATFTLKDSNEEKMIAISQNAVEKYRKARQSDLSNERELLIEGAGLMNHLFDDLLMSYEKLAKSASAPTPLIKPAPTKTTTSSQEPYPVAPKGLVKTTNAPEFKTLPKDPTSTKPNPKGDLSTKGIPQAKSNSPVPDQKSGKAEHSPQKTPTTKSTALAKDTSPASTISSKTISTTGTVSKARLPAEEVGPKISSSAPKIETKVPEKAVVKQVTSQKNDTLKTLKAKLGLIKPVASIKTTPTETESKSESGLSKTDPEKIPTASKPALSEPLAGSEAPVNYTAKVNSPINSPITSNPPLSTKQLQGKTLPSKTVQSKTLPPKSTAPSSITPTSRAKCETAVEPDAKKPELKATESAPHDSSSIRKREVNAKERSSPPINATAPKTSITTKPSSPTTIDRPTEVPRLRDEGLTIESNVQPPAIEVPQIANPSPRLPLVKKPSEPDNPITAPKLASTSSPTIPELKKKVTPIPIKIVTTTSAKSEILVKESGPQIDPLTMKAPIKSPLKAKSPESKSKTISSIKTTLIAKLPALKSAPGTLKELAGLDESKDEAETEVTAKSPQSVSKTQGEFTVSPPSLSQSKTSEQAAKSKNLELSENPEKSKVLERLKTSAISRDLSAKTTAGHEPVKAVVHCPTANTSRELEISKSPITTAKKASTQDISSKTAAAIQAPAKTHLGDAIEHMKTTTHVSDSPSKATASHPYPPAGEPALRTSTKISTVPRDQPKAQSITTAGSDIHDASRPVPPLTEYAPAEGKSIGDSPTAGHADQKVGATPEAVVKLKKLEAVVKSKMTEASANAHAPVKTVGVPLTLPELSSKSAPPKHDIPSAEVEDFVAKERLVPKNVPKVGVTSQNTNSIASKRNSNPESVVESEPSPVIMSGPSDLKAVMSSPLPSNLPDAAPSPRLGQSEPMTKLGMKKSLKNSDFESEGSSTRVPEIAAVKQPAKVAPKTITLDQTDREESGDWTSWWNAKPKETEQVGEANLWASWWQPEDGLSADDVIQKAPEQSEGSWLAPKLSPIELPSALDLSTWFGLGDNDTTEQELSKTQPSEVISPVVKSVAKQAPRLAPKKVKNTPKASSSEVHHQAKSQPIKKTEVRQPAAETRAVRKTEPSRHTESPVKKAEPPRRVASSDEGDAPEIGKYLDDFIGDNNVITSFTDWLDQKVPGETEDAGDGPTWTSSWW